ncbi:hypothetical protein BKD30_04030 [Tersicoccus phoenicis]|uniref:Polysaccharide biosynthesis protein C-terminal domain-containing protein n=2 Tax=Tersicoccus phoenicis TaxID=554083 RepID=A0A1R1LHP7_9MICC|nr:hypothetical protein BKD30_04030 [Tersicoccus phoenicis]
MYGLLGSFSQGLTRFLYSVLIGRFLGAADLANINSAISLALFLSLLWPTSAGQAATRFVAQLRGEQRPDQAQAVANHLGVRMLGVSVPLAALSVGISITVLHLDVATASCAGLLLLGYAGWSFTRGVQYGAGQIVRSALWDVAGSLAALVMLAAVLIAGLQPFLLLPLALSYGLYAVVCWPAPSTAVVDTALLSSINAFVRYGVLGTLSSAGMLQLSMLAANMAGTGVQAGMYAAALSLATPATMLARTGSQVLFPAMAEAGGRNDAQTMRHQTDAVTRALVVAMPAVFGGLALASPLLIDVLYGQRFAGAQDILPVLLIAVMFTTIPVAAVNRLNATGIRGARFVSIVAACGLLVAFALWLVFGPVAGVLGVALGYLVATSATSLVMVIRCWRMEHHQWTGVVLRFTVSLLLLASGVIFTNVADPPHWVGIVLSVSFVGVWTLVNFREIRTLRAARPRPTTPTGVQRSAASR